MTLAGLSIKRPIFITCIVILMMSLGLMSLSRMAVDLFPDITFPVVMVNTPYSGAGPQEVETLVSKVIEEEVSTLPGIKTVRSINIEGVSTVIAEFNLDTDIKYAEQQVRDRVSSIRSRLPDDILEPTIRRIDPADQPIVILALTADLPEAQLFDLAEKTVKPQIEQVNQVGMVTIIGGREREIQVVLDRRKLKEYELSATSVSQKIGLAGQNIPAGKVDHGKLETVFRTVGEFDSVKDIGSTILSFFGNDVPVTVNDVGRVIDTVKDETSRAFVNGEKAVFLMVFRQSGANTIAVADGVKTRVNKINSLLKEKGNGGALQVVRDGAKPIRANVLDVQESILLGILLTIVVVYFFLGSFRSTIITGLAIPNSLIGAFFLMWMAGFTINVMSLLALSLAVGLLIDDAIVVRENIFRHNEMGKSPIQAAMDGSKEVGLAVIAVTLAVVSVFGPIAFLDGVVGQFFKEFGLTICFAMAISLFDALTIAPMLSAYFGGVMHDKGQGGGLWARTFGRVVKSFDRFQSRLEGLYEKIIGFTLRRPMVVIGGAFMLFVISLVSIKWIPKTFVPAQDTGEFMVTLELPPGASLDATQEVANQVDQKIRANPEVYDAVMILGGRNGESNTAMYFVHMVDSKKRKINTSDFKDVIRQQLKPFAFAKPIVKDADMVGGGMRAFNLNISGTDLKQIEEIATLAFNKLKDHPGLKDVEISHKPGKPEFQVLPDKRRAEVLGISSSMIGQELRAQVEGLTPVVYREAGEEYDVRVRLQKDQRDLSKGFESTYVPNINNRLVRLKDVAQPVTTSGPATINRQDRARYIQLGADIAPNGPGMAAVMSDIRKMFKEEIQLPEGVSYSFQGQAENFQELIQNMIMAALLGMLFIYLVLSSLYESFVTPFTILLVLPLAACGAFFALLITQSSLDLFSMIGCVMLMGVASKNSILLVDYTKQLTESGMEMSQAIIEAGKTRLRPILMTSFALIAGMLPIAIGLNEASKQRTSMGISVIGGLISSTLLTLVVVPATYAYIERFRVWSSGLLRRIFGNEATKAKAPGETGKKVRTPVATTTPVSQ